MIAEIKNYLVNHNPYKYITIQDFLDENLLKRIEDLINSLPIPVYIDESDDLYDVSIPHKVLNLINFGGIVDKTEIEIDCIIGATESDKDLNNAVLKKIPLCLEPRGHQAINRTFIDKNNIENFPDLKELKEIMCSQVMVNFLENNFGKSLLRTRLRMELLRNRSNHFLTPHRDCKEKVISFLIYINNNNQPIDTGTDIYVIKDEKVDVVNTRRVFDNFETVATIPFINNTAFIFSPDYNTWHGLNPDKKFDDRKFIQLNYVTSDYSTYEDCFDLDFSISQILPKIIFKNDVHILKNYFKEKNIKKINILGKGPTFKTVEPKDDELIICINETINFQKSCDILLFGDHDVLERIDKNLLKNAKFIIFCSFLHLRGPAYKKYDYIYTIKSVFPYTDSYFLSINLAEDWDVIYPDFITISKWFREYKKDLNFALPYGRGGFVATILICIFFLNFCKNNTDDDIPEIKKYNYDILPDLKIDFYGVCNNPNEVYEYNEVFKMECVETHDKTILEKQSIETLLNFIGQDFVFN